MQINGGILSTGFQTKTPDLESKSRSPVVINATPNVDFSTVNAAVNRTTVVNPVSNTDPQQQARFVRTFASVDNDDVDRDESEYPQLPYGVKQYLDVAQSGSENNHRLVDETV